MNVLDDVTRIIEMVRKLDKFGLLDDLLDELLRLRGKIEELLKENRRLRERLRARLEPEDDPIPYEGIYWFANRCLGGEDPPEGSPAGA